MTSGDEIRMLLAIHYLSLGHDKIKAVSETDKTYKRILIHWRKTLRKAKYEVAKTVASAFRNPDATS